MVLHLVQEGSEEVKSVEVNSERLYEYEKNDDGGHRPDDGSECKRTVSE
jgi:hypothetical protein